MVFIFEKPWLTTGADSINEIRNREEIRLSQTKSGLKMLISAMSMIFFLVIVSYFVRMKVADWQPLPEPWLLWLNTASLIFSSLCMQAAVIAARQEQSTKVKNFFLMAGVLAWGFLAGQLWAWQQLIDSGYFIASNPANTFFYMITALHGLHLLGGLGIWVYSMLKMRQQFEIIDVRSSIELCTTYWHFLLVVWIVLYSLLLYT